MAGTEDYRVNLPNVLGIEVALDIRSLINTAKRWRLSYTLCTILPFFVRLLELQRLSSFELEDWICQLPLIIFDRLQVISSKYYNIIEVKLDVSNLLMREAHILFDLRASFILIHPFLSVLLFIFFLSSLLQRNPQLASQVPARFQHLPQKLARLLLPLLPRRKPSMKLTLTYSLPTNVFLVQDVHYHQKVTSVVSSNGHDIFAYNVNVPS